MSDSMSQVPQSLPLPAGSATAAKQDTGNSSLASIDANIQEIDDTVLSLSSNLNNQALLADALTNPTSPTYGSYNFSFNGTTWDRVRSGLTTIGSTFTGFFNALPWAVFHTTPTVRTTGQGGPLEADANGNLLASLGTKIAGEDLTNDVLKTEAQMSYTRMSTATTTTIKSGAGFFHALTINKHVATGTITIYDNTAASGTVIALITAGAAILSDPPINAIYNVKFTTGLTIITSQATDLTVSWR